MNWGIFRWYAKLKKLAGVEKRIVCLASSDMAPGRCIAGKELRDKSWIRPVNGKPGEGLSRNERLCWGRHEPNVLDIIDVPVTEKAPRGHQSENWLINSNRRWKYTRKLSWGDLGALVDDPDVLWRNDYRNDRVSLDAVQNLTGSLYLLRVEDMVLWVSMGESGKRFRGQFTWQGISYNFAVTDPVIKHSAEFGRHDIGACYVTVSLAAVPFHGFYYKLIAAIITPNRVKEQT
ncbi:MAG: hypothetical protein OXR07_08365 [Nitrospira sp.]|nr:hypothetical protein [Nitrospira sp.]